MSQQPPQIHLNVRDLPVDPKQRHEVLVDVFGQYIMWLRNWTTKASGELVESEAARQRLGAIRRRKYDAVAAMSPDQRIAACELAEATVDRFIQLFLTLLAGTGVDQRLGRDHAVRLRLILEVLRVDSHEVVHEEIINRDGRKFFADYWGRWINQLSTQVQDSTSDGSGERA